MKILFDKNLDEFMARISSFLMDSETGGALLLGLLYDIKLGRTQVNDAPFYIRIEEEGEVVGCAIQTPPRPIIISKMRDNAVDVLVKSLILRNEHIFGVTGPAHEAKIFAQVLERETSIRSEFESNQYAFELDTSLTCKLSLLSEVRVASEIEKGLVADWLKAYFKENLASRGRVELYNIEELALKKIQNNEVYLGVKDNRIVSMICLAGETSGSERIQTVYTFPDFRKEGFEQELMQYVSSEVTENRKKKCFLHINQEQKELLDMAKKIGYKEIYQNHQYRFIEQ